MIKTPYSKRISEEYVKENLENSDIVSFLDYEARGLQRIFYEDLNKNIIKGFPFASDFVDPNGKSYTYDEAEKLTPEEMANCKLRFHYLPYYHELYIGTTGSGKTTGCIEPQIRAISSQKNKPNLFITDPKGELFEHHARHLKENGYNLFIINFKDFARSHTWNPLHEMFETNAQTLEVGKSVETCKGKVSEDLKMMNPPSSYKATYLKYKDMAFSSKENLDQYCEVEKYMIRSQTSSLVNQFSSAVFLAHGGESQTWIDGARGLMNGILLTMLEESLKPNTSFTKEMMTLKTVNDVYALLRDGTDENNSAGMKAKMQSYLRGKSTEAMNKLNTVITTHPSTRKGYLSTFQTEVEKWMQGHIFQLTADTSIELNDEEKPFAIFVATRDYDKSDNIIAGLFIDWVYRQSLHRIEKQRKEGKPTRDLHFLLDEFANIPRIPDFDNKISTARSRSIWFHLFIQSYDQLDLVYGKNTANIIVDNCNEQCFLGSQSQFTKERFSKECGKKTVTSLKGLLNGNDNDFVEIPVVQVSALDQIQPGEMYTKRIYSPVLKCSYIRSYQCANLGAFKDFYDSRAFNDLTPINLTIPDDEKHTFEAIMPRSYFDQKQAKMNGQQSLDDEDDDEEFDFKKFIGNGGRR